MKREKPAISGMKIGGVFSAECFDQDGNLKWKDMAKNIVVDAGLNHILGVEFHGDTQITSWYGGLVNATPTYAAGDTLSSHTGWSENSNYTGSRKAMTFGAAASKQISNSGNAASFSINGTGTIAGAFICSVANGTTGTLFCEANFGQGNKSVSSGDTVNVTYTLSAGDDGV
jgi:hypothetical protein